MPEEEGPTVPHEPVPPAEQGPGNATPPGHADREASAAEDLADGIDLMLRAARKAVRSLDPRIEDAGRRALERLEQFDASTLGELGRKAAAKVGPERLEQVAEEAGREISAVVERIAERVESVLGKRAPASEGGTRRVRVEEPKR